VTFGQNQNTRRPVRLKLVKSSGNDVEPALFSDSIHNYFEVGRMRDPNTIDSTYEMEALH
jgi:hypothetical protein